MLPFDGFDHSPRFNRFKSQRYGTVAINRLEVIRAAAADHRPRFVAVPDEKNIAVPARRTYDAQVWLRPGSMIWALSGWSEQSAGFRGMLTDAGTGERMFQQPVRMDSSELYLLPQPRLVIEPGLVLVTLINLAAVENQLQLCIWYAEPHYGDPLSPATVELQNEMQAIRQLRARGALSGSGSAASYSSSGGSTPPMVAGDPPYLVMPPSGVPYREAASVATPAAGSSADILTFTVPQGMDCSIRALSAEYTGPGWEHGSSDLTFRVQIDGAFVRGYDGITTPLGSASDPHQIQGAIRASSGQVVQIVVEHAATSALPTAGTRVIASAQGWFYPRQ